MCSHPVLQVIPAAPMVSIAREEGADSREVRREGPGSASSSGVLERGSEEATWHWLLKTSRMRGVRPLIRWREQLHVCRLMWTESKPRTQALESSLV